MLISKAQLIVKGEPGGEGHEARQLLKIVYEEMPDCPRCSAPMSVRDHFWRVLIGMDGVRREMRPRRLVCTCETCELHTRPQRNLPQGVVPRRQYSAEVHQAIAEGRRDVPCADNTIHRIYRWLLRLADFMLSCGLFMPDCENVNEVAGRAQSSLEHLENIAGGGEQWLARVVERAAGRGGGLHWV